jgi:hypothetical protein
MRQYPYQSLVGMLMYAMLGTWPEIAFAVGVLSKFSSNLGKLHWNQEIHILKYLAGTKHHALIYCGDNKEDLSTIILGYTDSDWAREPDTRHSTGGYELEQ